MATVSCNVNLILIVIDSDEDTLISAQLRLGLGGAIPCELLFDDPHGEDDSDDDSDDDDDDDDDDDNDAGVHLADPQPRHLAVHHDQVPQPCTGHSAATIQ